MLINFREKQASDKKKLQKLCDKAKENGKESANRLLSVEVFIIENDCKHWE